MASHIYKPFDDELQALKDKLLAMGGLVEAHIQDAVRALVDLPRMAAAAQAMLRNALDAFITKDAAKAEEVLKADDPIDGWLVQVFEEVVSEMQQDPSKVARGVGTLFFAKHIERSADH